MLRSLEQERANYAWKCIEEDVKGSNRRKRDESSGLLKKIIEKREIKEERKVEEYYDKIEKSYNSYIKRVPVYIQTNGLGNSLAFYKSKFGLEKEESLSPENRAYKLLYCHINEWSKNKLKKGQDILEWIISDNASSTDVFRITKEILALLSWMKRFAEAELKEGEESE